MGKFEVRVNMIAQLSISRAVSQPELRNLRLLIAVFVLFMSSLTAPTVVSSELELQIRPLSAIDKHYMAEQRQTVESLANRLGRRLSQGLPREISKHFRESSTCAGSIVKMFKLNRRWVLFLATCWPVSLIFTGWFTGIARADLAHCVTAIKRSMSSQ